VKESRPQVVVVRQDLFNPGSLELRILLPWPPECWDYRREPACPAGLCDDALAFVHSNLSNGVTVCFPTRLPDQL
jgi:hypothetical protein